MTKHRWLSSSTYLRVFCVFANVVHVLLRYKGEMINLTLTQKEIFYCRHWVSSPICLPPFTSRLPPTLPVGLSIILLISHYSHIFLFLGLNLLCFTLYLFLLSTSTKVSRFRKSDSQADVCNSAVFTIKPGPNVTDGDSYLLVQSPI